MAENLVKTLNIQRYNTYDDKFDVQYFYIDNIANTVDYRQMAQDLTGKSFDFPSPAQHAYLMMEGLENNPFLKYTHTNIIALNNNSTGHVSLIKRDQFDKTIGELAKAHHENKEYFLTKDSFLCNGFQGSLQELADAIEVKADGHYTLGGNDMMVIEGGTWELKSRNLGYMPLTGFLFSDNIVGDVSKDIGNHIRQIHGKRSIFVCFDSPEYIKRQEQSYVHVVRFGGPKNDFNINGNHSCHNFSETFMVNFTPTGK